MANTAIWERTDFARRWTVTREIADALGRQGGWFEGEALLTQDGEAGLVYAEVGILRMGEGQAMTATRRYLWSFKGDRVEVSFADGRPFHGFRPVGAGVEAVHLCGADSYHATYDFNLWPDWRARWRVTGPHKDYTMMSLYRCAAAKTGG